VKLRRWTGAIAENGRQSSLLNHETSIERNVLCCAAQRKAGECDDGLPGFMHGWEREEKVKEDGEMRSDYELVVRMKSSFIYRISCPISCCQCLL
jgi:hypothetical protein